MSRKQIRNGAFLTVTAAAIGLELWHALDGDPSTRPWTDYLTDLPGWVLAPAVAVFVIWLPAHLWAEYRKKHSKEN